MSAADPRIIFPEDGGEPYVIWGEVKPIRAMDDMAERDALLSFLSARLDEETEAVERHLRFGPPLRRMLGRHEVYAIRHEGKHIANVRALIRGWEEAEREAYDGYTRGVADGMLLALMIEASTYDWHPDWREDWSS